MGKKKEKVRKKKLKPEKTEEVDANRKKGLLLCLIPGTCRAKGGSNGRTLKNAFRTGRKGLEGGKEKEKEGG